jgi:hypothetical protein
VNLKSIKLIYFVACVGLCLVILSPTLLGIFSFPEREGFSSIWVLGADRRFGDYPFMVSAGEINTVYVGVENYMGGVKYYLVYVNLRSQTDPWPGDTAVLPDDLVPVSEYRVFLRNGESFEKEISFSFTEVSFDGNVSRVLGLSIDGRFVDVEKESVWDSENNVFFYQLFFELWIYNPEISDFEFHNRSVGFWLNLSEQAQP